MSEWQEFLIEDLAEFCNAKRVPLSSMQRQQLQGSYPYYGASGIVDYINDYIFEGSHILISEDGENLKSRNTPIAFEASGKFWVNNHAHILKAKEPHLTKILIHYFAQLDLTPYLTGAVQPKLNKATLSKIPLYLPSSTAEQKAIASVLSSLDDKIDLLHRQNKTLEAMAETLFRQWFIEEAKEDWEDKQLGTLLTVKRGGSPRPIQDYLSDSGYCWLKISDVTSLNSPFVFNIKEHIKEEGLSKTTLLQAGKLVLSNSATPAIPKILMVDTCIHDGWLHFPVSTYSNEYLYLLFNHIRPELLQLGNGSIFTNLKTDILKEYVVKHPDEASLLKFQTVIEPIFTKLLENAKQIQTLEKLRDMLLPKLMSGEVRVQYQTEEVA
ncbi:restriction endonuclease subunit S [Acinetobacter sp. YH01024]|uniref:restriction endonuclease subunit S n=1 Tax=Acinetobacter sp. YH01024 TaxID=2601037 RepID=UPI0015D3D930|nr:restriction endonuclease subunit S [Acinetobacter sp. YH01024]